MRRGLLSTLREPGWGTSVASLFGVLFLAQMLILHLVGAHAGLTLLRERTDIRLEILESASDVQIQDFIQNARSLPYVEDIVYVTREQAYERERKRDPELLAFLTKFGIDNPFPETVGIRLASLDDYPKLLTFLEQPVFARTVNPAFLSQTTDQQTQVYRLIDVIGSARMLLVLEVAILVLVLVFITIELVQRRAIFRREELYVEQLVGATPLAILIPFCIEILVLLLVSLVLSLAFAAVWLVATPTLLPELSATGLFSAWSSTAISTLLHGMPWIVLGEIVCLLVVSLLGTLFGLLPRLKMQTLEMT